MKKRLPTKRKLPPRAPGRVHSVRLCLRTHYRQRAIWGEYIATSIDLFTEDIDITMDQKAKTAALIDACIYLRVHRGYYYSEIYVALLLEIKENNLLIDPSTLDLTTKKNFIESLERYTSSDGQVASFKLDSFKFE